MGKKVTAESNFFCLMFLKSLNCCFEEVIHCCVVQIKFPTTRGQNKLSKQDKKPKDEDMEIGTYAPNWTSPTKKSTSKWNDK